MANLIDWSTRRKSVEYGEGKPSNAEMIVP